MGRISDESLAKIKSIDLLSFFDITDPGELVRVGSETYSTKTHDSVRISHGLWIRNSSGVAGRSALDYLIKIEGYTFVEAATKVWETCISASPAHPASSQRRSSENQRIQESKQFALPTYSKKYAPDVLMYLTKKRGISERIIRELLSRGDIIPSVKSGHCNVIFVGRDTGGAPRYGFIRGVHSDFKGEMTGGDKRFSFTYGNPRSKILYVYEGAIDLLSDITLMMRDGEITRTNSAFISAGGVTHSENKLPKAVEQYLFDHPYVNKVYLCFDNDGPGKAAVSHFSKILRGRADQFGAPLEVIEKFPPENYKDYNDALCCKKENANKPAGIVQDGAENPRANKVAERYADKDKDYEYGY